MTTTNLITSTHAIIEGKSFTSFPDIKKGYHGYAKLKIYQQSDSTSICTGSLIDKNHILTAAHCFRGFNGEAINLRPIFHAVLGDGSSNEKWIKIKTNKVIIHESFTDSLDVRLKCQQLSDIAIIELPYSIDTNIYHPVNLPESRLYNIWHQPATTVGFGFTNPGKTLSNPDFRIGNFVIDSRQEFSIKTNEIYTSKLAEGLSEVEDLFSASGSRGKTQICKGDSGGPILTRFNGVTTQHMGLFGVLRL